MRRSTVSHTCDGCGHHIPVRHDYVRGCKFDPKILYNHCRDCNTVWVKIKFEGLDGHYSPLNPRKYLIDTRDYDETAADIADLMRLPVAYVSEVIK